jgi:hypothetical protein
MPAQTVIKVRRDTATNWASTSPAAKTLAQGEIGLETDTGKFKVGVENPTSTWNSLPYANPTDLVTAVSGALSVSSGTLSVSGITRYTGSTDTLDGSNPYPKVTVKSGSTGPVSPAVGDVWIKYTA